MTAAHWALLGARLALMKSDLDHRIKPSCCGWVGKNEAVLVYYSC